MLWFLKTRHAKVATALLLAQAAVYYSLSAKEVIPSTAPWSEFPDRFAQWTMLRETPLDSTIISALQPDDYINRQYESADNRGTVSLFVGYFKTQRKGLAPHSPKACLPGAGWVSIDSEVQQIYTSDAHRVSLNEYLVAKGNDQLLVHYWYQQGGRSFANEIVAQLYALPQLFMHGRSDIALVRIITPIAGGGRERAREVGIRFVKSVYPLVVNHIP